MKKTLLLAALTMLAINANASKARMEALQGPANMATDVQDIFNNPSDITQLPEYVTFEFGPVTATSTMSAEGGFSRAMGDAKYGFYLGHKSASTIAQRVNGTANFMGPENPFEITYGMKADMSWGASFAYSSSDVKSLKQKQNAMGIRLGAQTSMWDAALLMGLGSTATGADLDASGTITTATEEEAEFKGTSGMSLRGGYNMESMYVFGEYARDGNTITVASADTKTSVTMLTLGVENKHKLDGGEMFYGVSYHMDTQKVDSGTEVKVESSYLPVIIGVEADAASWLVLRGSITQNVLLGSSKANGGDADTIPNNTTVAAGMGVKFNKFMLDAVLKAGSTGNLGSDAANFASNASLTYMF